MRFNIANKAPLSVEIEGVLYKMPILRRKFWIDWASEIDGRRLKDAVSALPPLEAAKMLLIYPVEPVLTSDLVRRLNTMEGTDRVFRTSAKKAEPVMPDDVIERFLEETDARNLESLIRILAGLLDFAEQQEKQSTKDEDESEEGPPGPLADSTKGSTV